MDDDKLMIQQIKQFLIEYYAPAKTLKEADLHLTTTEIFERIYRLFPSPELKEKDIASWLNSAGFTFFDFGEMRFEWLLKKID